MAHFCRGALRDRSPWSWQEIASTPTATLMTLAPSHAEISALAFSYWEARGRHGGSAIEDWLRAERELRKTRTSAVRG